MYDAGGRDGQPNSTRNIGHVAPSLQRGIYEFIALEDKICKPIRQEKGHLDEPQSN